jgi:6-phosphogluconolactonase (cycloisomerase 2 family)
MNRHVGLTLCCTLFLLPSAMLNAQQSSASAAATTTGHQFVYVADASSGEISGFQVLSNGTLAPVAGSPFTVPSQPPIDIGPLSIVYIAPYLVASGSNPHTPSSLTVFHVNQQTGSLTEVPAFADAQTFMDWEGMTADVSRHVIYASGEDNDSNNNTFNGIAVFKLLTNGSIQRLGPKIVPGSPASSALALDPLGHFLYAFNSGKVFVFKRNADGTLGSQVAGSPFTVGAPITFTSPSSSDPCFFQTEQPTIAVHPSGHFIYTSCNKGTEVTVSAVSSTGRLTPAGSVLLHNSLDRLSALFVNHAGTLLFATQEQRNEVLTFKLINGHPVFASEAAAGLRPNGVVASPGSVHLFVSNGSSNIFKGNFVPGSNNLSFYSLSSSGKATQSSHSPVSTGAAPRSVVMVTTP